MILSLAALAVVTLIAAVALGASNASEARPRHTITGSFLIPSEWSMDGGCGSHLTAAGRFHRLSKILNRGKTFACAEGPGGGYSDITNGTQVTVRSANGTVLAAGQLSNGRISLDGTAFDFRVPKVPEVNLYQIEVAQRGAVTYRLAQLKARGWAVDISLG